MSITLEQIELKPKGFLIQYSHPFAAEFIPFSQVKSIRYSIKQYDNSYDVHIHLVKEGVRVVYFKNEDQCKHFFHNIVNHYNQCV